MLSRKFRIGHESSQMWHMLVAAPKWDISHSVPDGTERVNNSTYLAAFWYGQHLEYHGGTTAQQFFSITCAQMPQDDQAPSKVPRCPGTQVPPCAEQGMPACSCTCSNDTLPDTSNPPFGCASSFAPSVHIHTPSGNSATTKHTEPPMRRPEPANNRPPESNCRCLSEYQLTASIRVYPLVWDSPNPETWTHNIPPRSMASYVPSGTSSSPTCHGTPL